MLIPGLKSETRGTRMEGPRLADEQKQILRSAYPTNDERSRGPRLLRSG